MSVYINHSEVRMITLTPIARVDCPSTRTFSACKERKENMNLYMYKDSIRFKNIAETYQ